MRLTIALKVVRLSAALDNAFNLQIIVVARAGTIEDLTNQTTVNSSVNRRKTTALGKNIDFLGVRVATQAL
jgi:hypothetical protein